RNRRRQPSRSSADGVWILRAGRNLSRTPIEKRADPYRGLKTSASSGGIFHDRALGKEAGMERDRGSLGVENRSARILFFVAAAAILSPKPTLAGQNVWTSHGPDKSITAVASKPSDPRTVYAATKDAGVYKTIDGGETWTRLAPENSSLD